MLFCQRKNWIFGISMYEFVLGFVRETNAAVKSECRLRRRSSNHRRYCMCLLVKKDGIMQLVEDTIFPVVGCNVI